MFPIHILKEHRFWEEEAICLKKKLRKVPELKGKFYLKEKVLSGLWQAKKRE
jgi:hypothetical protein